MCNKVDSRTVKKVDAQGSSKSPSGVSPNFWYIHGRAYDLNAWIGDHPGGKYVLNITRGTDCTELFESYHAPSSQSAHIQKTLEAYAVDAPAPAPEPYDWVNMPVYEEMKTIVRAYKRRHGIKASDSMWWTTWYAMVGTLHYVTMARWLMGVGGLFNCWLFGTGIWFWGADLTHSGTHYNLTHSPVLSEWIGWLGGCTFMNTSAWVRQHVTGHHSHTNVLELDPDLYHQEVNYRADPRVKPHSIKPLLVMLPWVTQIIPVIMGTAELGVAGRWKGTKCIVTWADGERVRMWAMWAVYMSVLLTSGWTYGFAHAFLPFATVGFCFYMASQVSHINKPSFDTPKTKEWAVAQITACQGDYGYYSPVSNHASIGLNNQTFHHLFPSVHAAHYPALMKLVKPVFVKHGLATNVWNNSYMDSMRLHFGHLYELNQTPGCMTF